MIALRNVDSLGHGRLQNRVHKTRWWAMAAVLLLAPSIALGTDVSRFSGHITDVGIQRGPGQVGGVEYRIRGSFALDPAINLGTSVVTLEMLFAELGLGGAGELMTMMDDVSFLPYELIPKTGTPDKVLYDTPDFRPQIRMQIWRSSGGGEFRIKLDRGLMRRVPQLCTNDPRLSTTDMTHSFTIDDGVHAPILIETTQPWECNPKDNNMRSRGRRSTVPPPVPTATPMPGATPTPGPTAVPSATPGATATPGPTAVSCSSLPSRPEARLIAEPVTRVTGAPDAIELDGRNSTAPLGTLVRYLFESGDGRVQDGPTPVAVFTYAPGDYRAWLTVYDDRGACARVSRGFSDK